MKAVTVEGVLSGFNSNNNYNKQVVTVTPSYRSQQSHSH